jgi:hypothetical protein
LKGDVHVTPIDDLKEHEMSRDCWCKPLVQQEPDDEHALVIHNAEDGRELVEEHGLQ